MQRVLLPVLTPRVAETLKHPFLLSHHGFLHPLFLVATPNLAVSPLFYPLPLLAIALGATAKNLFTNSGLCYVEAITRGVIMSHYYPSDISREQFARVLPALLTARRRTKPRIVDLYDVFRGVLYVLKSGCQWRMLPADLPQWQTCYKYFRQLPAMERAAQLGATFHSGASLKKSVGAVRQSNGRKERTSFGIVDAQSVKNTDRAENKGYDAGKKVSGIKRHIAVDTPRVAPCDSRDYCQRDRPGWGFGHVRPPPGRHGPGAKGACWLTGVTLGSPLPRPCSGCWAPP